jgi:hypothetical protein
MQDNAFMTPTIMAPAMRSEARTGFNPLPEGEGQGEGEVTRSNTKCSLSHTHAKVVGEGANHCARGGRAPLQLNSSG